MTPRMPHPMLADVPLRVAYIASGLVLAPVLAWQGRRVRRTAMRLPLPDGDTHGVAAGEGAPLHLCAIGESTVASIGVERTDDGLAPRAAHALAATCGRPVHWRALGLSGATARTARTQLVEPARDLRADVALVALGVNDVVALRTPERWVADLAALVAAIRARCGPVPVVMAEVPPVGRFPTLPQPLRGVLGLEARLLDRAARRWAAGRPGVAHVALDGSGEWSEGLLCRDGVHPSALGYARWGALLGRAAAGLLALRDATSVRQDLGRSPPRSA